jgi:hypothetical protein
MKYKLRKYIGTWSFMRLVRLLLGIIILVQGFVATEIMSAIIGGTFTGMALLNIGCNGACPINTIGTDNKNNEPDFEEVVIKK